MLSVNHGIGLLKLFNGDRPRIIMFISFWSCFWHTLFSYTTYDYITLVTSECGFKAKQKAGFIGGAAAKKSKPSGFFNGLLIKCSLLVYNCDLDNNTNTCTVHVFNCANIHSARRKASKPLCKWFL